MSQASVLFETFKLMRRSVQPRCRLVLFPYLGGNASLFNHLAGSFDRNVEVWAVTTVGHHWGSTETPLTNVQRISSRVATDYRSLPPMPTVFLGYSMGALIAFETAVELQSIAPDYAPKRLMAFASKAPDTYFESGELAWKKDDDEFVSYLTQFGALPQVLLDNRELLSLFVPMMKADHRALEEYVPTKTLWHGEIDVVYADRDPFVGAENTRGWSRFCTGKCAFDKVEGDHMFLFSYRDDALRTIRRAIDESSQTFGSSSTSVEAR